MHVHDDGQIMESLSIAQPSLCIKESEMMETQPPNNSSRMTVFVERSTLLLNAHMCLKTNDQLHGSQTLTNNMQSPSQKPGPASPGTRAKNLSMF